MNRTMRRQGVIDGAPVTDAPILGIDCGGTGTRAVLLHEGRCIARYREGPMNALLHADGTTRLAQMIVNSGAASVGIGLAGLRGPEAAYAVQYELSERTGAHVVVGDDTEAALLGAFGGEPGIVVLAGTGNNALGRDAQGGTARAGGYGFLLGDEGSGYWLAAQAIRMALRSHDRTGPHLPEIEAIVLDHFEEDFDAVVRRVHSNPGDRRLVAELVPTLASSEDPALDELFTLGADHLVRLADAIRRTLGPLRVSMSGGIFQIDRVRRRFVEATGAVLPLATPEVGAARLASVEIRTAQGETA
jgi:N-acetylglucosamine kinase-like BadF-type ATPase